MEGSSRGGAHSANHDGNTTTYIKKAGALKMANIEELAALLFGGGALPFDDTQVYEAASCVLTVGASSARLPSDRVGNVGVRTTAH